MVPFSGANCQTSAVPFASQEVTELQSRLRLPGWKLRRWKQKDILGGQWVVGCLIGWVGDYERSRYLSLRIDTVLQCHDVVPFRISLMIKDHYVSSCTLGGCKLDGTSKARIGNCAVGQVRSPSCPMAPRPLTRCDKGGVFSCRGVDGKWILNGEIWCDMASWRVFKMSQQVPTFVPLMKGLDLW